MNLIELLAATTDGRTTITDNWLQGRTTYGGLSTAIALSAVKQAFPDLPPLRSAQIAFVGPLNGTVNAIPALLRRGKNSAFTACSLSGNKGPGLQAMFLSMNARDSELDFVDLPMPNIANPKDNLTGSETFGPGFLTNFDLSHTDQAKNTVRRWVRLKHRDRLSADIELIAVADALPPAAMVMMKQWGQVSTTTWQLNLLVNEPRTRDGWWLLEAKALHAAHGSSSQAMTIWNSDGEPQATATQSVALFR